MKNNWFSDNPDGVGHVTYVLLHKPTSTVLIGEIVKWTEYLTLTGRHSIRIMFKLDDGHSKYVAPIVYNPKDRNSYFEVLGRL